MLNASRFPVIYLLVLFFYRTEKEEEMPHICHVETLTPKLKCIEKESDSEETTPEVLNGVAFKEPPHLREVDTELLQSGRLKYTGKLQR